MEAVAPPPWYATKLEALDYPQAKNFSIASTDSPLRTTSAPLRSVNSRFICPIPSPSADPKDIRGLVAWLEDSKIKHLKAENRKHLKNMNSTDEEWRRHLSRYLDELGCKRPIDDLAPVLDWLLTHALVLEYALNAHSYNVEAADYLKRNTEEEAIHALTPSCDFNSPELKAAVAELAAALHLPPYDDPKVVLGVILQILEHKFAPSATSEAGPSPTLKDLQLPLGFDTGDPELNAAATVLRLLYIQDLRDLQSRINEIIISVQNITANPKTDSTLGKVGK